MKYHGIDINPFFTGPFVTLGQEVYAVFSAWNHWSFVTPVNVHEIVLILSNKNNPKEKSRWFAIGGEYEPTDTIAIPPENLDEWVVVNSWYWADEPLAGHAIYDEDDGVFVSFQRALESAKPWKGCRKAFLRKALKQHRDHVCGWLTKNHLSVGAPEPVFNLPERKVWVRRK